MHIFIKWLLSRAVSRFLVGNRGVQEFVIPKALLLLALSLLNGFGYNGWLFPATLVLISLEIWMARREFERELREGFTTRRSRRVGLLRTGISLVSGFSTLFLFYTLPWWLALPLSLPILLIGLIIYLVISFFGLIKDMRGAPATADSAIYQQVREMHELDKSIEKMQLRLLSEKTLDSRRDLTFYLAWAETYRGHFKLNSKEYGKALAIYKEALRVDPSNMGARVSLTVCYTRQSEFELALRQLEKAIHTFNGQHKKVEPHYDQGLWHWHRNEVSSEYEQSAGLFQLCGFVLAYLRISDLSGGAKELLERDIVNLVETIPDRSQEELLEMLARKGGTSPGAMGLLAAGPYRRPASPLDLLSEGFCLPLLPLQSIEPAA